MKAALFQQGRTAAGEPELILAVPRIPIPHVGHDPSPALLRPLRQVIGRDVRGIQPLTRAHNVGIDRRVRVARLCRIHRQAQKQTQECSPEPQKNPEQNHLDDLSLPARELVFRAGQHTSASANSGVNLSHSRYSGGAPIFRQDHHMRAFSRLSLVVASSVLVPAAWAQNSKPQYPNYPSETPAQLQPATSIRLRAPRSHDPHARRRQAAHRDPRAEGRRKQPPHRC